MNRRTINNIFLGCCVLLCLGACSGSKSPAIYIDGDTYKFGKVKAGQEVVFTFFISNPGTADLVLKDLYISCECVVVKEYDRVIKPGTRGKVYGVIKTEGLSGDILRAIKLKTNIPDTEPILKMEGTVLPPGTDS